jgi:carbon monoxide dehydrogenase subunit G
MARYTTTVRTSRSPEDAFTYMADLRNFADWDPGVTKVVQIEGSGGGAGSVFDVTVKNGGRDLTLRYRTVEYTPHSNLLVVAKSKMFTSTDRVTVSTDDEGTTVVYDALLELNGLLKVADLVLRPVFKRIGDRATAGLRTALQA